jgi:hypothetical protein
MFARREHTPAGLQEGWFLVIGVLAAKLIKHVVPFAKTRPYTVLFPIGLVVAMFARVAMTASEQQAALRSAAARPESRQLPAVGALRTAEITRFPTLDGALAFSLPRDFHQRVAPGVRDFALASEARQVLIGVKTALADPSMTGADYLQEWLAGVKAGELASLSDKSGTGATPIKAGQPEADQVAGYRSYRVPVSSPEGHRGVLFVVRSRVRIHLVMVVSVVGAELPEAILDAVRRMELLQD